MKFKKVAFYTLGCKVNQYETESLKKQFIANGFEPVEFSESADVYVVNSCTVTSIADKKTRNILRRAKKLNDKSIVVATGCYAQTNGEELSKIEEIDYVVGNSDKSAIFNLIKKVEDEETLPKLILKNIFDEKVYEEIEFSTLREMSRAYIKIQDGCNNFCSYCKIPFARGASRSRKLESILDEIKNLSKDGFKEIILIGINLGAYGEDLEESHSLEDILEESAKIEGIERIRLGSIYPDKINDRFIKLLKTERKIMSHLHISLQAGDDEILKLMKRNYKRKDVLDVLGKLKEEVPNIEFTGDVIVGFPHEKENNFLNTYNLIEEIEFSDLHIFQYSDREKTLAAIYEEKVDAITKKERADKLEKLRDLMYENKRNNYIGKKMKVLVEEIKHKKAYGYTENYIKVQINNYEGSINNIVEVEIKELLRGMLVGD
jgi:threonylcarbamoyladenosine tRNA methylthiotransferase MtaB